jgi:hypothetical protein
MENQIIINDIFLDYLISSNGDVFSLKKGVKRKLKQNIINGGYAIVRLYHFGKTFDRLVHRLVADSFIDNNLNKNQVNHIDGNKLNNSVDNLEWSTQSENIKHAYANKLMNKSYKDCYNASLNEKEVSQIRRLLTIKIKQRDIARKYSVSESVISSIKHGRSYVGIGLAIEKK